MSSSLILIKVRYQPSYTRHRILSHTTLSGGLTPWITVFSMQGVTGNFDDLEIHSFRRPSSLENIVTFSDADMGGFSKVRMDLEPLPIEGEEEKQCYGRFHGSISIELPPDQPKVQRSGYAAWRTVQRGRTLFGRSLWNIDPYAFLALRIKSDGSKYFINIQTDSIVETDLHQHRLFSKTPGKWEVIHVCPSFRYITQV